MSPVTHQDHGDGIFGITMDQRPANALGPPILDGLTAALDAAGDRTVVISSAIPGFFAAGADIKHMSGIDAESFTAYGDRLRAVLDRLAGRLTIAVIEGTALGGGLELAMACTFRVAGANATFGLPEVRLGLIPGAGGTQRLPRLIGRGRAIDMIATARQVRAAEAKSIGLVDRLVDAGQGSLTALELARKLGGLSAPAISAALRTIDAAFDLPLADGLRYEAEQVRELFEHGEAKEGLTAFLEKRSPQFGGPR